MSKMSVNLSQGVYRGACCNILVRTENGLIIVFIDAARLEFRTPDAFKIGFALVKKAGESLPGNFVSWVINGKELQLTPEQALKVGGVILKKTDDADDFQLGMRTLQ